MITVILKVKNDKKAGSVAESLINERYTNSVDVLPGIKSYSWVGKKCGVEEECMLLIKTKALLYSQLENKIKSILRIENPKMYSLPMTQIDDRYRARLRRGVKEV